MLLLFLFLFIDQQHSLSRCAGTELEVLSDLLVTGVLTSIDNVMVEFHERFDHKRKLKMQGLQQGLGVLAASENCEFVYAASDVWNFFSGCHQVLRSGDTRRRILQKLKL